MLQPMQGHLVEGESFVSSMELENRETLQSFDTYPEWPTSRRMRGRENVRRFRSWDEVQKQEASDREIVVSDLEKHEKSTDSVVLCKLSEVYETLGTRANTSEELLDSQLAGEC